MAPSNVTDPPPEKARTVAAMLPEPVSTKSAPPISVSVEPDGPLIEIGAVTVIVPAAAFPTRRMFAPMASTSASVSPSVFALSAPARSMGVPFVNGCNVAPMPRVMPPPMLMRSAFNATFVPKPDVTETVAFAAMLRRRCCPAALPAVRKMLPAEMSVPGASFEIVRSPSIVVKLT